MFRKDNLSPEQAKIIYSAFLSLDASIVKSHIDKCLAFSKKNIYLWDDDQLKNELEYHQQFRVGMDSYENLLKLNSKYTNEFVDALGVDSKAVNKKFLELKKYKVDNNKCIREFCRRVIEGFDPNKERTHFRDEIFIKYSAYFIWDNINKQYLQPKCDFSSKGSKTFKTFFRWIIRNNLLTFKIEDISAFLFDDALMLACNYLVDNVNEICEELANSNTSNLAAAEYSVYVLYASHYDRVSNVVNNLVDSIVESAMPYYKKLDVLKDVKNFSVEFDVNKFKSFFSKLDVVSRKIWLDNVSETNNYVDNSIKGILFDPEKVVKSYKSSLDKGYIPTFGYYDDNIRMSSYKIYKEFSGKLGTSIVARYELIKAFVGESEKIFKYAKRLIGKEDIEEIFDEYIKDAEEITSDNKKNQEKISLFLGNMCYFLTNGDYKNNELPVVYYSIGTLECLIDCIYDMLQIFLNSSNKSEDDSHRRNREKELISILRLQRNNPLINIDLLTLIYAFVYDREYYGGLELRNRLAHFDWGTRKHFAESAFALVLLVLFLIDDFLLDKDDKITN